MAGVCSRCLVLLFVWVFSCVSKVGFPGSVRGGQTFFEEKRDGRTSFIWVKEDLRNPSGEEKESPGKRKLHKVRWREGKKGSQNGEDLKNIGRSIMFKQKLTPKWKTQKGRCKRRRQAISHSLFVDGGEGNTKKRRRKRPDDQWPIWYGGSQRNSRSEMVKIISGLKCLPFLITFASRFPFVLPSLAWCPIQSREIWRI